MKNHNDDIQLRKWIGDNFVSFLDTNNRLCLANSQNSQGLAEGPSNLLEILYTAEPKIFERVRKDTAAIFQKDIFLSPYNPGRLEFKISNEFTSLPVNPQEIYRILENISSLDEQGDGMRCAIGIIAAVNCTKKPVVLIDEPEAFLHPPQALQLGKIIGERANFDQQFFIATHSADFLRGLLSSTQDIKIIHIGRSSADSISINILEGDLLKKVELDPLLSSSRVLDGLFYQGVVATEADADATFYQRAFQIVDAGKEIHFINAHNKQTLKKVIEPYQRLSLKFALIADADVLRDEHEFKEILQLTDKRALKERILLGRRKIADYFEKQSKYDILMELQKQIKILSEEKLVSKEETPEKITSSLYDLRRKLGKLREDSDEYGKLKKEGGRALPPDLKDCFDKLCDDCASIGLFIVKVGELESWLEDYGINRTSNKSKWITEALTTLYSIKYDKEKELWKFIDKLKDYLTS